MITRIARLVAGIALAALTCGAAQAVVMLDSSFGDSGFAYVDTGVTSGNPVHLAIAPDHDIVVAQLNSDGGCTESDCAELLLVKLRTDGTLDANFADGGIRRVRLADGASPLALWRLLMLPDGGLFVVATLRVGSTAVELAAIRLDADGRPSVNFNNGNLLTFSQPGGSSRWTAHVHGDGFLLASAPTISPFQYYDPLTRSRAHYFRVTADGRIDANFGVAGHVEEAERDGLFGDTMLLPEGRFQVLHTVKRTDGIFLNHWKRYRADGFADYSAGVDGWRDVGDDGRIALVNVFPLEPGRFAVASSAMTLAGFLDGEGRIATPAGFRAFLYGTRIALPFSNGRTLIGREYYSGFVPTPFEGTFAAAVDANGVPDRSFTSASDDDLRLYSRLQRHNMVVDSPSTLVVGESTSFGQIRVTRYLEGQGTVGLEAIPALTNGGIALLAMLLLVAGFAARRHVSPS